MNVLSKSVTGEELSQQLISTLAVQLGVAPSNLLATMWDGAVVNGAAVQLLKASNYTECQETICFLQTIGNAGKKFDTPDLDDIFHLWSSLFSHSCAAPPSASGEQQDQMPPSPPPSSTPPTFQEQLHNVCMAMLERYTTTPPVYDPISLEAFCKLSHGAPTLFNTLLTLLTPLREDKQTAISRKQHEADMHGVAIISIAP